jgi:hypothetical protein
LMDSTWTSSSFLVWIFFMRSCSYLYWNCGSVCILLNCTRVCTLFSLLNIQVWFLKKTTCSPNLHRLLFLVYLTTPGWPQATVDFESACRTLSGFW